MLNRLHNKLLNKSTAYRDWHRPSWSSMRNAMFLLLFSVLVSGVGWYAKNPAYLSSKDPMVLGAATDSEEDFLGEMEIRVTPLSSEEKDSYAFVVQTSRPADVWVEYDEKYDRRYLILESSSFGSYHYFLLRDLIPGGSYAFRIGTVDKSGIEKYSRLYSFTN